MASSIHKDKLISILICSKDRRSDLEKLISNLKDIKTDLSYEIIIVEETNEASPIDGVIYIPHAIANRGIPFARNLALSHAKGEIIIFLDDDCVISDQWLENLLEPFANDTVVGVQGGVTVPSGTNQIGWAESLLGFPGGGISRVIKANGANQETIEISTLNCAYRKSVIDRVGGFEKSLKITGEDYVLAKQICQYGTCLFVPRAMVSHQARGKLAKIWHWFIRRGRAEVDVIRSGAQETTTFWTLVRGSLTTKLLSLLFLSAFFPHLTGYFLLGGLLFYSLLQYRRFYRIWHLSKAPVMALILLPVIKLTMDVAVDWGRFRGLVFD